MASIYKAGRRWRAQVSVQGHRRTRICDTKAEASQWVLAQVAQGKRGPVSTRLVLDALKKLHGIYVNEGKSRSDIGRAKRLQGDPLANCRLVDISSDDLADFRDRRLTTVTPASVRRELNLIRGMFRRCRKEWRWMTDNPFVGFDAPSSPESRKRRVTADEIARIRVVFGLADGLPAVTLMNRAGLAFLFSLETAMRASEILGLTWQHAHLPQRFVHLPKTKNGDERDVPLTTEAVRILEALPRVEDDERCFLMDESQRDAHWRKGRDKAAVVDLHFHDARAEAIWRLSKRLDVLQLARAIGHRDINSLLLYYRESAADMAAHLD